MATLEQLRQIFPDAASDEDAIRRASERFGIDPKSIADEVGYDGGASSKNRERMSASVDNYQSNLYGVVGAGARAVGATGLGAWADRRRDDNAFQANIATARAQDKGAIESYKDIGSLRDAGDYVVGLGIQSAPYMAEAFAGGAAGRALLGGATLGSKALASTAGAVAASYPSSVGDILQNQRDQNGGENLGSAVVGGIPYALLNAGLGIEGRLSRASLARNTAKVLDDMPGARGVAARTAGTVAKVGAEEGASELGQEFVNQYAGRMAVDPALSFLNPESEERFKESFIGGAALGGVFGGLGGGWRRSEAFKPPVNDTPGSSTDLLDSAPAWTTTRGFDARTQPEPGAPGPLGDTSPEWTTSPGAAQPRGYSPVDAAGLYPAVGDPAVTTGSRRGALDVPAVPGRPDLADSMVAGGPSSQVAATDADNAAMMDPGAIAAREQQAAAMRERAAQKAATDAAAREFAGRRAAAHEELVENGPDGKPMIQLKPQEVVLHHDLATLKATGQITPEQYTAFAGAFKEALMSDDKKAINAVRKEVEAIKNPKPEAQGITNGQRPDVPVPTAVVAGPSVAGSNQPGGSVGDMGRVAADAAQRSAPAAGASVSSVPAPGAVVDGNAVAAPVAAPAAPVPVVLKKTKKLQPLPPVEAKSTAPDAAPVAPKAPLTGLRRVPRAEAGKTAAPQTKPRQAEPAAPAAPKYDNLPDLIDAVAKENGIPQVVADAYMEHKVLDRSLDKIAKDIGVGKSTIGDWVKKLHPLVEDAKLTRLEAGARSTVEENTADHEAAPGAEAAVEGEDAERADGPVEADNAVSAEDATTDETGEEGAPSGETDANINIENDGHGKGKTKADSGITPARDKALQKSWDQLSAALPEDQRVQWKDLGESQRGAFDFESSKGAGNARRAHSQITQMANEGMKFSMVDGQSMKATLSGLIHPAADGAFAGLTDLPVGDNYRGIGGEDIPRVLDAVTLQPGNRPHRYGAFLYRAPEEHDAILISAAMETVKRSSVGRLYELGMKFIDKIGVFYPAVDWQERAGGAYLQDHKAIILNTVMLGELDTSKPSLALAQTMLHEPMHALDTAAGQLLTGHPIDASTTETSPTSVTVEFPSTGAVKFNLNPVAKEALKAYKANPTHLSFLTQSMRRLLNDIALIAEEGGSMPAGVTAESLDRSAYIASTELMPKLMEMYSTAPEMLEKHLPLGFAYAKSLAGVTTIQEAANVIGGKSGPTQEVQAGGAGSPDAPVRGQVRQVSVDRAVPDAGRERGAAGEVAGGRQDSPGNPTGRAGGPAGLTGNVPPPILDGGKGIARWLKNLTSDKLWRTMPGTLGFLSTEQLADRFSDIPMVKSFSDVMRAMGGLANKIMVQSDRLNSEWKGLAKRFGKDANDKFSELLLDATTINAWPDEDLGVGKNKHLDATDAELIAEHKALQQKYRSLPEPYRNLFHKIVADKADHREQKVALLKRGIVESYYPQPGDASSLTREMVDAAAKVKKADREAFSNANASSVLVKNTLAKLWNDLDAHAADFKFLPGPYFPKMRFGDHIVSFKSSTFRGAEEALKTATDTLQSMLAADTYKPIADVESDIKSLQARLKRSTVDETKARLKQEIADARAEHELLMKPITAARELVAKRQEQLAKLKAEGQHYGVEFYESRALAQVNEERLRAHFGDSGYVVQRELKNQFLRSMDGVTPEFMRRLESKVSESLPSADAQKVRDSMRELYLRLQPENSALKSQLKRFNVAGVRSEEAQRAYATSSMRDAHSISRLRYGHELHEHVNELRFTRQDEDAKLIGNELALRIGQNMASTDHSVLNAMTNLTYMSYLGMSPSFMLTQITQPWVISAPVMAARHGIRETSKLLSAASVDAAKLLKASYDKDRNFKYVLDPQVGLEEGLISADEAKMLTDMLDSGRIDITITRDLGASSAGTDGGVLGAAAQIASYPAQQLETVNRIATALAAYRAEKAKTGDHLKAMQYADTLVADTHLNYASENRARHMHPDSWGGYGRVMFQFRAYQQGMLYLIYKNMVDGFGAKKDADARKAVAYLAGMQLATAGLAGMPVPGVLAVVVGALYKAFEDDDDEKDLKEMLFQGIKSVVGETGAIAATKGIPAALGVDVSSRVGMGNIADIVPYSDDSKSGRDWVTAYFAAALGGPTLGMAMNWAESLKAAGKGDFVKAAAMAAPKVLADPIRAAGYQTQGLLDSRQNTILGADEISGMDSVLKAAGFQPTDISRLRDQRQAFFDARHNRDTARAELLSEFVRARTSGGDVQAVREKIAGFNERHADDRITVSALERAVAQRRVQDRNMRGGIPVGKRDRALAAELGVE